MKTIRLKVNNRYKDGNVVFKDSTYRGNSKTMELHRPDVAPIAKELNANIDMYYNALKMQLNPPIIVGQALGDYIDWSDNV